MPGGLECSGPNEGGMSGGFGRTVSHFLDANRPVSWGMIGFPFLGYKLPLAFWILSRLSFLRHEETGGGNVQRRPRFDRVAGLEQKVIEASVENGFFLGIGSSWTEIVDMRGFASAFGSSLSGR